MSEYQCYEFVALDRQLTTREMAELRSISTRARITPTRFRNEYAWGDLKADAGKLLARYFDAHLYTTNWGTRRFMLRLPASKVDLPTLRPYFPGGCTRLAKSKGFVVLDFWSVEDDDPVESVDTSRLATFIPIRSQVLQGDLRAAYIAWLCAVQADELDEDALEPPVPAGLSRLGAPLASLVELLGLDSSLLAAAAGASGESNGVTKKIRGWVRTRPAAEKDRWLLRAVDQPESAVGVEILAAFRKQRAAGSRVAPRTVAELRACAERNRAGRAAGVLDAGGRRRAAPVAARRSETRARRSRGRAPGRRTPRN